MKFARVMAAQVRKCAISGKLSLRVKLTCSDEVMGDSGGDALFMWGSFWHVKASVLCSGPEEHPGVSVCAGLQWLHISHALQCGGVGERVMLSLV